MIGYLEGYLIARNEDAQTVTLLVGEVGYEIRLPHIVYRELGIQRQPLYDPSDQDVVPSKSKFFIYQHQTERSPCPLLIGFRNRVEREFFTRLITVQDIGPTAAAKALTMPIRTIARAIEERDLTTLSKLKGIGRGKAEKIAATLAGKMAKFALMRVSQEEEAEEKVSADEVRDEVVQVLTSQLGYKKAEAEAMVDEALEENPGLETPEELFDAVYRARR